VLSTQLQLGHHALVEDSAHRLAVLLCTLLAFAGVSGCVASTSVSLAKDHGTGFYVVDMLHEDALLNLIFDTGASASVLSQSAVERHSIETEERSVQLTGSANYERSGGDQPSMAMLPISRPTTITLGEIVFGRGAYFLVLDLSFFELRSSSSVDGIFSPVVLQNIAYSVDFAVGILSLSKGDLAQCSGHPVTFRNGLPYVLATVNGTQASFLLDSGAVYSTVDQDFLESSTGRDLATEVHEFEILTIWEASKRKVRTAKIDEFRVGKFNRQGGMFIVGSENVIGLDILSSGKLDVNKQRGCLSLQSGS